MAGVPSRLRSACKGENPDRARAFRTSLRRLEHRVANAERLRALTEGLITTSRSARDRREAGVLPGLNPVSGFCSFPRRTTGAQPHPS